MSDFQNVCKNCKWLKYEFRGVYVCGDPSKIIYAHPVASDPLNRPIQVTELSTCSNFEGNKEETDDE